MIGDISIIGFSTMGISEFYGETNTNEAIDDIAHYGATWCYSWHEIYSNSNGNLWV